MDVNFRREHFTWYTALEIKISVQCALNKTDCIFPGRKCDNTTELIGIGHCIELLNIYLGFEFCFLYCFTIIFCKSVSAYQSKIF